MDGEQLVEKILQSLVELEQEGELVLTTNSGSSVARYILDSALKQLVTTFRDSDAPIECTMPHLLEQTIDEVPGRAPVRQGPRVPPDGT